MLTLTIFLPTLGAIFLLFFNKNAEEEMRDSRVGGDDSDFRVLFVPLGGL